MDAIIFTLDHGVKTWEHAQMKMLSQMAVMRDITEDISIVHTTTLLMEHNSALKHMAQEMTLHVSFNSPIIIYVNLPRFTCPTKFTV